MAAKDDRSRPTLDINRPDLLLSDCICPICMSILIEPVTMPCSHELCMPCFRKNVEEANFTCPMCRIRISSWARKRSRENKLIDQNRWRIIQAAFPEKCRRRLEGFEDESFEEEIISHNVPNICEPGEVRKEYEEQLNQLRQQKRQEEELEFQASAELIKKLQEEEMKHLEEMKKASEVQRLRDEELAKKLNENVGKDVPVPMVDSEPDLEDGILSDEELAKRLYDQLNHVPEGDEVLARKLQQELNQVPNTSRSPDASAVPGPSKKTPSGNKRGSRSSTGSKEYLVSIETFFAKASSKSTSPSRSDSESCFFPDYVSEPLPSRSCSDTTDLDIESLDKSTEEKHQEGDPEKEGDDTDVVRRKSPTGGRNSATSIDSIAPELNHFKPIHTSPRTPPKRRLDGTLLTPVLVHTTPCNLSKSKLNEDESWLQHSPLVMAKWLSLADERKQVLANQSKGTMTGGDVGKPSPHLVLVSLSSSVNDRTRSLRAECDMIPNHVPAELSSRKRKASSTVTSEQSAKMRKSDPECGSKQHLTVRDRSGGRHPDKSTLKIPSDYKSDSDEEIQTVLQSQEKVKTGFRGHNVKIGASQSDELGVKCLNEKAKDVAVVDRTAYKIRTRNRSGNRNNNNSVAAKDLCKSSGKPSRTLKFDQVPKDAKTSKVRTIADMFNRGAKNTDNSLVSGTTVDSNNRRDKLARTRTASETSCPSSSPRSPRKTKTQDQVKMCDRPPTKPFDCTKRSQHTAGNLPNNSIANAMAVSPRRRKSSQANSQCASDVTSTSSIDNELQTTPKKLKVSDNKDAKDQVTQTQSGAIRRKRQTSGDQGNKPKKFKADGEKSRRSMERFTSPQKPLLSQEELDFQLAMKLQRQYDNDWRRNRNNVNRAKGSRDSYLLRHNNTTNPDPSVHTSIS